MRLGATKSKLISNLIFLLNCGLPLFMLPPIFLNTATTPFMIILRGLILLASIVLLFSSTLTSELNERTPYYISAFFIFWFIYLSRIIFDLYINPIPILSKNVDTTKVANFALFMCFLPSLTIYLNRSNIDIYSISRNILDWIFLESVVVLILMIYFFKSNFINVFTNRSLITHGDTFFPINPITISRIGASLVLASIYTYTFLRKLSVRKFILYLILGLVLLIIGGSRGPFISLFVILFILSLKWMNSLKYYLYVLFVLIVVYIVSIKFNLQEIDFIVRILSLGDSDSFDRIGHWNSALSQFIANPIIGDKIFDDYLGSYPHNLILEVFMSVGLLGGIFFSLFFIALIRRILKVIFYYDLEIGLIGALCLLYFIFSLSSSSIYYSIELWSLIALLLFYPFSLNEAVEITSDE